MAEKKVKVFIPRTDVNGDQNRYVKVNGVAYLLPCGKESEVPESVAAELRRSYEAQDRLSEYIAAQQKKAARQAVAAADA